MPAPATAARSAGLALAILGDSIAWGQGATREGDRLGPRLVAGLAARGHEVTSHVFAVPGARSAHLDAQVTAALGWRAQVAVVVIGANDLTHLVPVGQVVDALRTAVRRLRAAGCEVVVAPAPDLSSVPHVPVFLRDVVRAASLDLRARQAEVVTAEGGRVADAEDRATRAFAADRALFSADLFHPSSAGYAVIADSLLPTLVAAVEGTPPAGSL